ncbi:hypothetical protein [Vibrio inusitatus]|nr:hypothetical protein [Vibrio inusitatus]
MSELIEAISVFMLMLCAPILIVTLVQRKQKSKAWDFEQRLAHPRD